MTSFALLAASSLTVHCLRAQNFDYSRIRPAGTPIKVCMAYCGLSAVPRPSRRSCPRGFVVVLRPPPHERYFLDSSHPIAVQGFGGVASGPQSLRELHDTIREVLDEPGTCSCLIGPEPRC
jgi:hypothetical protein